MKDLSKVVTWLVVPVCLGFAGVGSAANTEKGYAYDSQGVVVTDTQRDCVRSAFLEGEVPVACGGIVEAPKPAPRAVRSIPPRPPVITKTLLEGSALFDTNKSVLKPAGKVALDRLAREIKSTPGVQEIHVFGYTDSTGSYEKNLRLSEMRALSARNYLEDRGLSNIVAEGRADRDPAASNDTAEGRAKNRRVEIEVVSQSVSQ
jgi:outer membrane protein OmpA-like peptidoglycan-associated protein